MMSQKTLTALKEGLKDRGIQFKEEETKKDLLDRLWDNRKTKNTKFEIKQLPCTHLFH